MPFTTPLDIRLIDPLANDGQGEWELLAPLEYVDDLHARWVVPAGFRSDLASVSRLPLAFVLTGNSNHAPAVLHDWAIVSRACPRAAADDLFLAAMESLIPLDHPERSSLRWRAGAMFRAVSAHTRNLADKRGRDE